ncbi:uncharacterized protein CLUP02_07503 [Colletotrichum lupini]|uniref:Uncharacterized protein n=1 Tax=Colletotrichum lupini TaxID=145971 RepID=A0A9Q8SR48_9PEZI|nr:uncharacterized protein CLUP02_07503 [Colletotrichum lupini]UQC82017.1 hypothetical protein CLUP02_07503 [Colletotrichum lupini]
MPREGDFGSVNDRTSSSGQRFFRLHDQKFKTFQANAGAKCFDRVLYSESWKDLLNGLGKLADLFPVGDLEIGPSGPMPSGGGFQISEQWTSTCGRTIIYDSSRSVLQGGNFGESFTPENSELTVVDSVANNLSPSHLCNTAFVHCSRNAALAAQTLNTLGQLDALRP